MVREGCELGAARRDDAGGLSWPSISCSRLQRYRLLPDGRPVAAGAGSAWPQSCNFGGRDGRRLTVVAYLFAELTISATDHLALSFLNVLPATFRKWRRPTG